MNITVIEARDLPEAWFLCCKKVLESGYEYTIDKGSFQGQRRKELDFITLKVEHPGRRPLAPDVPQGVLPPSSMDYVDSYLNEYLLVGSKKAKEGYTYGEDIEPQIHRVMELYEEGFETNQACITVGSKDSILLNDPQCLRVIDTRIRYGALHFVVYFRSWDLWAGLPTNLAAIQLMKELLAGAIGVEDGELIAVSKGLHLYDYSWELAKIVTGG